MKTILMTGGNRGLGRAAAEKLAAQGHRVILTARNLEAGERAVAQIRAAHAGAQVEARALDLSSLAGVRRFAESFLAEQRPLDVLFHNAGVMQQSETRRTTPDGFEETLAVNALSPFFLTSLLVPSLAPGARVVCVSSRLHLPGSRGVSVDFDFDDVMLEKRYHPERAYKNSKLATLWFAFELDRRLAPRVRTNGVCPGFVPITAAESTHGFQKWLMKHVLVHMPFAETVDDAAKSYAFMATDPSLEGVGGKFFAELAVIDSSPDSRDEAKAKRFWDLACQLTGARW